MSQSQKQARRIVAKSLRRTAREVRRAAEAAGVTSYFVILGDDRAVWWSGDGQLRTGGTVLVRPHFSQTGG